MTNFTLKCVIGTTKVNIKLLEYAKPNISSS